MKFNARVFREYDIRGKAETDLHDAFVFDLGRAWGGDVVNTINPGWLSNAGVGLRIVSARAAFSNVLHVDLAFPLNTTPDIKKVQFLVKTKTSF